MGKNSNITFTDVLLYKPFKYKKKVNSIIETFNKALALLNNETTTELKKLNNMSQANANYVSSYEDAKSEYDKLKNTSAPALRNKTENLVKKIDNKDYKTLKEEISVVVDESDNFYNSVLNLNQSIKENFQAEEEVTKLKCNEQTELRKAKAIYRDNQSDLRLVENSYRKIFEACDEMCLKVDEYIQTGQYVQAKRLLENDIHKMNVALNKTLSIAPKCCVCISQILPRELKELKNLYNEMREKRYPTYHILQESDIYNLEDRLKKLEVKCAQLSFTSIEREIDYLTKKINDYHQALDAEIQAKLKFEGDKDTVYKNVERTSNKVVSLINSVPTLKKAYFFEDETDRDLATIQACNEQLNGMKNELYSFEHSKIESPYTLLLEKMNTLNEKNNELNQMINKFLSFLEGLKKCAEEANRSLSTYTVRNREFESKLVNLNHKVLCDKYMDDINNIYTMIDDLYAVIRKQPINVKEMNKKFESLANNADSLYDVLNKEFKNLEEAEKAMVDLNTSRLSIRECDRQFKQAEELFYQGDFKSASDKSTAAKLIDKEIEEL